MKPTCANCVLASMAVGGAAGSPHASATSMAVTAASWRSRKSAPFGRPVVPDVNTRATGRSGSSGSSGTGSGRRSASTSSRERTSSAPPARSATAACSGGASRGFTPAATAPTLAAAAYATTYALSDGSRNSTTSPAPTPEANSPAATSSERGVEVRVGHAGAIGVDQRGAVAEARRGSADGGGEGHRILGSMRCPELKTAWPSAIACSVIARFRNGLPTAMA